MMHILILAIALFYSGATYAIQQNDMFPTNITLPGVQETKFSAQTLLNKVTVINLWATWCASCKVELKEMAEKFAPLFHNQAFQFAAISLDKDSKQAEQWMRDALGGQSRLVSSLYFDPQFTLAESLDVSDFPVTLVVGPKGTVQYIQRGFTTGKGNTENIVREVENLLAK